MGLKEGWDKKEKVAPVHYIKAYRGRRGRGPLILNLGASRIWAGNMLRPPCPMEIIPALIVKECVLVLELFLPVTGFERRIVQPVS
jgi:hypothetical protein